MVSGKDILIGERVGRGVGRAEPADGVQQHHSVGLEEFAALGEELVVMSKTDMLEHADRDDPVELAVERAIIDQLEPDMVGDARVFRLAGERP